VQLHIYAVFEPEIMDGYILLHNYAADKRLIKPPKVDPDQIINEVLKNAE